MPIVPKAPTLFDAVDLLEKHRDAQRVEALINGWHYTLEREGKNGYRLVRANAEKTIEETLSFAYLADLLGYVLETEGPAASDYTRGEHPMNIPIPPKGYAPMMHAIDWDNPDSQRFLSALERIATALENKHGAPDVYMQDEYEVLVERDKVLQSLVAQALHARDANQKHWLLLQMARQLGIDENGEPANG